MRARFTSEDERAHKWCEDLFQYYWDKAEPRPEVVERLYDWIKDKPGAINTLKDISTGKETAPEEETASKLEEKDLVRQGQLTMMGLLVYRRLQ
jgi:hypothetical protein